MKRISSEFENAVSAQPFSPDPPAMQIQPWIAINADFKGLNLEIN
jgi:hypothetical protein